MRHNDEFDEKTRDLLEWRQANPDAINIVPVKTGEESMKLNLIKSGAVIIAGSGMCTAGRVKHHLKHNLWRKESSVVIVGFQAQGTLGRRIVDGVKLVKVFEENIAVAADVYTIGGLSAHADRDDLLDWAGGFHKEPGKVLINHGEESVSLEFAETLRSHFGWNPMVPHLEEPIPV
jgi:metallo-beta-lactamase family protein